MAQWVFQTSQFRLPVTASMGCVPRFDKTLILDIDLTSEAAQAGQVKGETPQLMGVVEVNDQGTPINDNIPGQFTRDPASRTDQMKGTLAFHLAGATPANAVRRFHAYFDQPGSAPAVSNPVHFITLNDHVMHEAQQSYHIMTPRATYIYHKSGAGFASLLDPAGNDWISHHPGGGSDGEYRGIPNMVHPEGYFHPGNDGCESQIIRQGPILVSIHSASKDGLWSCIWDICPEYATLTVNKAAQPFWFLYEGTPGGQLDEQHDYIVRSTGAVTRASESWDGALPEPEWLYFGTRDLNRVLYLVHHEPDDAIDSYWPMEHNMTVFGFGRMNLNKYLTDTPAHFTIGFAEHREFSTVAAIIESAYQPVGLKIGPSEHRNDEPKRYGHA
ncbi:MAG: hypothetical protein P1S60_14295 [Anaerolineae bacterium]|nr:hypothetical protein [Anaerolineae bacterium]